MLTRQQSFTFFTTSYLRSLERAIGVYEVIRRREHNRIVLVDEGTVLLAHNLFVYTDTMYKLDDIIKFSSLAPLPDLIVYIWAPVDSLIERALARNDPPREMRSQNRDLIEQYIRRAVIMFDQLSEVPQVRSRILLVKNEESTGNAQNATAEYIAAYIMDRCAPGHSHEHFESITSASTDS
jgi:thymidylate kinase